MHSTSAQTKDKQPADADPGVNRHRTTGVRRSQHQAGAHIRLTTGATLALTTKLLPDLPSALDDVAAWVSRNLGGYHSGSAQRSGAFVGGQAAADLALSELDITGYAGTRSQVHPPPTRGASKLSPYIRHGLLPLPRVREASTATGSSYDQFRFGGELLWQDYSRHWYAAEGTATRTGVNRHPVTATTPLEMDPWRNSMACMTATMDELHDDGWVVNQARMWLATQWTVRGGRDWREGEDHMFRHLLDGSRAANRQGWQWVVGGTRDRAYGLARRQVLKRAPAYCDRCEIRDECPIKSYAKYSVGAAIAQEGFGDLRPQFGPLDIPGNPEAPEPEAVWLTAESLGDGDPALSAHPHLPAVFTFDAALLKGLMLDGKRLVFLAECLADLAARRPVNCFIGDPVEALGDRPVAVTYAPVPGFRRHAARLVLHQPTLQPWPYLRRPTTALFERLHSSSTFPSFRDWCRLTKP